MGVDTLIEVEDSTDASSGWARRPTEVVVRGTCTRIDQEPGRPPVSVLKLPRRSSGDPDPAQRSGTDDATDGNGDWSLIDLHDGLVQAWAIHSADAASRRHERVVCETDLESSTVSWCKVCAANFNDASEATAWRHGPDRAAGGAEVGSRQRLSAISRSDSGSRPSVSARCRGVIANREGHWRDAI